MSDKEIEKVLEELKKVIVNPSVDNVKITITIKKPKPKKEIRFRRWNRKAPYLNPLHYKIL